MNRSEVILCDFDGVMVNRFTVLSVKDFCFEYDISFDDFLKVSANAAEGLDVGQKREIDYFTEVAKRLSLRTPPNEIQSFFASADAKNAQRNTKLYEWLNDMVARGVTVSLATNVSRELAGRLEDRGFYDIFQKRYFSYKIGVTKTEMRFWEHVIEDLSVEPKDIIFIDDNQGNVDMAQSMGIRGMVYRNPEQAIGQISEFLDLKI